LADADVVNVHWLTYDRYPYAAALAAARPMVCTLQWCSVLPELPALVLCACRTAYALQEANRQRRLLVPNGIDPTPFPAPPRPPRQRTRIVRVCRPVRCAEYFWPALLQMLQACSAAELQVVGGEVYRGERIAGLSPCADVAGRLAEADIFVYAPRPGQGALDLVVLEAMASGLPCVVSDVPCVEPVADGIAGRRAPYGGVGAFAAAVVQRVRERPRREALGRQAIELVCQDFDVRQRLPLYEAAYTRAVAENLLPSRLAYWRGASRRPELGGQRSQQPWKSSLPVLPEPRLHAVRNRGSGRGVDGDGGLPGRTAGDAGSAEVVPARGAQAGSPPPGS
jgi:glycosyltransferase involved in cell wall biosynthesis